MTEPTYKPIIFSAQMVRAILKGRKTQTRRIVKFPQSFLDEWKIGGPQDAYDVLNSDTLPGNVAFLVAGDHGFTDWVDCPYGSPGSRLWVREAFRVSKDPHPPDGHYTQTYLADGHVEEIDYSEVAMHRLTAGKTYPSIHMPRWASRITLEISGVRVERVQDITEEDAIAEGCEERTYRAGFPDTSSGDNVNHLSAKGAFRELWESIHGPDAWNLNEWVWCLEFQQR